MSTDPALKRLRESPRRSSGESTTGAQQVSSKSSSSPAVVMECIQQIEAKHDLLQYKVDGWCVWPLLRFAVARALENLPHDKGYETPRKEWLPIVANDVVRLSALRKARYVVLTYSTARTEREGGLHKDIYFDDLLLDVGDYFKIESVNNIALFPNGKTAIIKSDITTTALRIVARRLARACGPRYIPSLASKLCRRLRDELELEAFAPQMIAMSLLDFYWSKKLYALLLRRIRPEYLLVADAGEYRAVAAAKEQGIKVIEFQHGIVNRHHPCYSWSSYALPYKASMPVPDRILLYGAHWQQELSVSGFWTEELCPVGNLKVDRYRKIRTAKDEDVCDIVLTTQGIDTERLIDFVSDFLKRAHGQLAFRLYVRMHPAYDTRKELYDAAFRADEHVHIIAAGEYPSTFELLAQANLHVSIYSACHYDALGLGVPTVILPLAGHENVLHLYAAGHAFLAETPRDLLDIVLRWRDYTVPAEVSEQYFRTGALENIKRELGVSSNC